MDERAPGAEPLPGPAGPLDDAPSETGGERGRSELTSGAGASPVARGADEETVAEGSAALRAGSGSGADPVAPELTIAGAAWKKLGEDMALVVLGRGPAIERPDASTPSLTVHHQGRSYRFGGRITTPPASVSTSRQTYRFEFRLPRRVQRWALERVVLHWRGCDFELAPPSPHVTAPARPAAAAAPFPATETPLSDPPAPVAETPASPGEPPPAEFGQPTSERYGRQIPDAEGQLANLRQEIERAKAELARVQADIAQARVQRDEAQRDRDRAREERDRAQEWLATVAGELEHVESELADRRGDLEQVVRELALRRAELERLERLTLDVPALAGAVEPALISTFHNEPPPSPPHGRELGPVSPLAGEAARTASPALEQLTSALSEVRRQMERVQLAAEAPPLDEEIDRPALPETGSEPPPPAPLEPPVAEPWHEPASGAHRGAESRVQTAVEAKAPAASESASQSELPPDAGAPLGAYESPSPPGEPPHPYVVGPEQEPEEPRPEEPRPVSPQPSEPAPAAHEAGDEQWPAPGIDVGEEDSAAAMRFPAPTDGSPRDREKGNWFGQALHRLAEHDREAGGRVLVSLLPAQAIATPRFLRYDLIVRELGIYAVDVDGLGTRIEPRVRPRPIGQSEAWITGSLVQLGDLAARSKRGVLGRLRRYPVSVEGERGRVDDLAALAQTPLRLRDLCEVGAQIEVPLLLRMVAGSIDPEWTIGERFTMRFEPIDPPMSPCYLRVNDGNPLNVTSQLPLDRPVATIRSTAWSLIHLLAGVQPPPDEKPLISGSPDPLILLQGWIHRLEGAWGE